MEGHLKFLRGGGLKFRGKVLFPGGGGGEGCKTETFRGAVGTFSRIDNCNKDLVILQVRQIITQSMHTTEEVPLIILCTCNVKKLIHYYNY